MERDDEIQELAALVREHLEWEALAGGSVVPRWEVPRSDVLAPVSPGTEATERLSHDLRLAGEAARPAAPAGRSGEESAAPSAAEKRKLLAVLASEAAACTRCRLHEGRTRSVFARGSTEALVAFVGEGPGYHEDQQGAPFVGPAGQLLDKMIAAMGIGPDEFYICNVVKCRPPENRTPLPDEAVACEPLLRRQLEIVAPKVIVALGRCAAENLGCAEPGRSWRGIWGTWRGVPVMPTYHPAFLLRTPEMKRPVWEDLQKVLQRLGRTAPRRRS